VDDVPSLELDQPSRARRPKIVVADDSALVLAQVSAQLAERFEIVAAVTDGRQAVDAVRRLNPDVVVLDIAMPVLNGFHIARELTQSGPRPKIVMLTMQESDDFVAAAVTAGAAGYVLKTRMRADLHSAIDHVIAGRLFVPSLTSLLDIAPARDAAGHAVQFGFTDRAFPGQLSDLLAAALRRRDVAAIVATEETRARVAEQLIAGGCDVARAAAEGRYLSLDARDALSQVMEGGRLDAGRVADFVDGLERSRLAVSARSVTIIGEPAPLLWRDGNAEAALRLERVWHDVTRKGPFLTVCPYPMEHFGAEAIPELAPGIAATHSAVCYARSA
jgi:DNA-binding NarL/FixJ family response regulator